MYGWLFLWLIVVAHIVVNAESSLDGVRWHRKLLNVVPDEEVVPNSYIFVLEGSYSSDQALDKAFEWTNSFGDDQNDGITVTVQATYSTIVTGLSLGGVSDSLLEKILDDPDVKYAEQDKIYREDIVQSPVAQWGLDRIDQRFLPVDGQYQYPDRAGANVEVYVFDSGIRLSHIEFGGRAQCARNFVSSESCDDLRGHGSHVAGTVGSTTYGVAKNVDLFSVKVLDSAGDSTLTILLDSLDWMRSRRDDRPNTPMVSNMSLGGPSSITFNAYVDAIVEAGVFVSVSAGNTGESSCLRSPSSAARAKAVASTTRNDVRSSFSSHGSCVSIFAPGSDIISVGFVDDTSIRTLSGSSMAAPHLAGVAALHLSEHPTWSPDQVWERILKHSVADVVADPRQGTPNLLLNTAARFEATPSPTMGPTAPSPLPTPIPTLVPTRAPTGRPSAPPSKEPTAFPSYSPSVSPTLYPTTSPSAAPSSPPSPSPTGSGTPMPSIVPTTAAPSHAPTPEPTTSFAPTNRAVTIILGTPSPSQVLTPAPTNAPIVMLSDPRITPVPLTPSNRPSPLPTTAPSLSPSMPPSDEPSGKPSPHPFPAPSLRPTTKQPAGAPTLLPSVPATTSVPSPAPEECRRAIFGRCEQDDQCCSNNCLELIRRCFFF